MDGILMGMVLRELSDALSGARVDKVTQPEKDLVVFLMRAGGQSRRLLISASPDHARIHLTEESYVNPAQAPMFCMLLRKHLQGAVLSDIRQLGGDRVAVLTFDGHSDMGDEVRFEMYFEATGRHTNLTLVRNGVIVDAVRHVTSDMSRVRQALPGIPYELPPLQPDRLDPFAPDRERIRAAFRGASGPLRKVIPAVFRGMNADTARETTLRISGREEARVEEDPDGFADRVCDLLIRLPGMEGPFILRDPDGAPLKLFPFLYLTYPPENQKHAGTFSSAMDAFYTGRDRRARMEQKSASLRHLIRTTLERDERKLLLQEEELSQGARMEEWRTAGELLIAQAHLVPKGASEVSLQDYYSPDGGTRVIALDPAMSAAQNAQRYFKRYRKAGAAMRLAGEQKENTLREISVLEQAMEDALLADNELDLDEVRAFLRETGIIRPEKGGKARKKERPSEPRKYVSSEGRTILVGRNSMQNERLTRDARGEDLWLHAKDIPGSHVIVRDYREGDEETLRQALRLAAYYSRGKGRGVQVDYTLRKYVKKPGGAPPGFVNYTHQSSAVVTVTDGQILAIEEA